MWLPYIRCSLRRRYSPTDLEKASYCDVNADREGHAAGTQVGLWEPGTSVIQSYIPQERASTHNLLSLEEDSELQRRTTSLRGHLLATVGDPEQRTAELCPDPWPTETVR